MYDDLSMSLFFLNLGIVDSSESTAFKVFTKVQGRLVGRTGVGRDGLRP